MGEDKTGKDARGGPMRIVYAVIIVGIIAIVAFAVLSGHGPRAEDPAGGPPTETAPAQ